MVGWCCYNLPRYPHQGYGEVGVVGSDEGDHLTSRTGKTIKLEHAHDLRADITEGIHHRLFLLLYQLGIDACIAGSGTRKWDVGSCKEGAYGGLTLRAMI